MNYFKELKELANMAIKHNLEYSNVNQSFDHNLAMLHMPRIELRKLLNVCKEI